ncbi:MAG: type II secretion system protein [Phycisphaeraceae bacterium]|nr:type II secretion system protein [Phycisphaeraceae bacterium]
MAQDSVRRHPPRWSGRSNGEPLHPVMGFSLIELLVVVSIVALLIGVLLPALGVGREAARRAVCLSQQRQMAIAASTYTTEERGYFPPAHGMDWSGTTTFHRAWDLTTIQAPGRPDEVIPGTLWRGEGIERIQQCPSYGGPANWLVDPYTGYNYNTSYVGRGTWESIPHPARIDEIGTPAGTALFGDGQWAGGANKFMRAPYPNPADRTFTGRWAGTQGFRHGGQTNAAFADGHGRSLHERFEDNADGAGQVAVGTGFLSADNRLYDLE